MGSALLTLDEAGRPPRQRRARPSARRARRAARRA